MSDTFKDLVVDNIGGVAVTGGIVRVELQRLARLSGSSENPEFEPSIRLAFSIDTLIRFNQAISATLSGLESKGVVKKNEGAGDRPQAAKKSVN